MERLGVTGPLGLGARAGAPLPTLLLGEVDVPPEVEDPEEVCATAAGAVRLSTNAARIAVFMPAPLDANVAMGPSFQRAAQVRTLAHALMQSTASPVFAN